MCNAIDETNRDLKQRHCDKSPGQENSRDKNVMLWYLAIGYVFIEVAISMNHISKSQTVQIARNSPITVVRIVQSTVGLTS